VKQIFIYSRPATPYYKLFVDLCQAFSSIYFLTTDNGQAPEAQAAKPQASSGEAVLHFCNTYSRPATPDCKLFFIICQAFSSILF
jgi:hypothetical protein